MNPTTRRTFLAAAAAASLSAEETSPSVAIGNRTHIFAKPGVKKELIRCLTDVLGCGPPMKLNAAGLSEPILAWRFPGGGALSVEFTEDALEESQVRRGAWMEIWSSDPVALKRQVLDAGFVQVKYGPTNTFYFAAPGGQIFGIVSGANPASGELRSKP